MAMNETGMQVKRILHILRWLSEGRKLTTNEIYELLSDQGFANSMRTVQRDMNLLEEVFSADLDYEIEGKEKRWMMQGKGARNAFRPENEELLSLYMLKTYLSTFSGTRIADEANKLIHKLESLAPGEVFSDQSFFWDQNAGKFDYFQYDPMLGRVLVKIKDKNWVRVKYNSRNNLTEKSFDCKLMKMFAYQGMIYVGAYVPKHDNFIALALHNIEELDNSSAKYPNAPDFDFKKFTKERFGVYSGQVHKVKLRIFKKYVHLFENRSWHSSQKTTMERTGDMILEMQVPLSVDFAAWVLSWQSAVKVLEPPELIDDIKRKLKATIEMYQSEEK